METLAPLAGRPSGRPSPGAGVAASAAPTTRLRARALLSDGSPAAVQRLGPQDADEVLALHAGLGDRDRYLRFSTLHPGDLAEYVRGSLATSGDAVSLGARVRGRLVGVVQLFPLGGQAGEVAAVVEPGWRDHGIATVLLEQLAAVAVRAGIRRFQAEVLAENHRMMRVLTDLGLPLRIDRHGGSLCIEVALDESTRYATAVEARHRRAAAASLRPVLAPASVALIGVGRREGSVGRAVVRSLRRAGYDGGITVVHPAATAIDGIPCVRSLENLPGGADLAVVAVPAAGVADVLIDCGRAGVRAVVLITAGLGAVPGLVPQVREIADRYAMRIVGPNTVGVIGPGTVHRLNTTFAHRPAPTGDIGLVAQSGGIAIATVSAWERLGLGLSAMVAIGDAVDITARDVLAWFDEDPGTTLAVLYAESEPDLRGLVPTAAHLASRMPVLAVETGTSIAGSRAAASHTARAATPRALREAAYDAAGIQTVSGLTDLAAAVALLRGQPLPGEGTVAVLTNVGGGGVLAADACVAAGLPVDPLPEDLQERLRAVLPGLAAVGNPVDASAGVSVPAFGAALTTLLQAPGIAAVVTVTAPTAVSDPAAAVGPALAADVARGGRTTVIDVRLTRPTSVERLPLPGAAADRFLVSVDDPGTAARALGVAMRRRRWLARPSVVPPAPDGVDLRAAREVVGGVFSRAPGGDWLRAPEIAALCRAAGLPHVRTEWVRSPAEAVAAAGRIGGPVAVKGSVAGVLHKGDAGLLRLPVTDPLEVGRAVAEWQERAGGAWLGAVVQPVVPPGDELLIGAVRDASAGAVVVVGAGGRATDALGHRVHRLAPVSDADTDDMLTGTGLFETEHGRALDRAAVRDAVRRASWLVDALPEVAELDVNPLVASDRAAVALDVRIRLAPLP